MRKRILAALYAVATVCSLALVVGAKLSPILGRFLVTEEDDRYYGDLYETSGELEYFKQEIEIRDDARSDPLGTSSIVVMGDSFFNGPLDSPAVSDILRDRLGLRVHNVPQEGMNMYPLKYFRDNLGYSRDAKILVLESVDRAAIRRAPLYLQSPGQAASFMRRTASKVVDKIFDNRDIEYLLDHSVLTHGVVESYNNARFRYLRQVTPRIGAWSEHPRMLFHVEAVKFHGLAKSEADIREHVRHIVRLRDVLRQKHNVTLIYLIIPSKYSIYFDLAGRHATYDGFIPRVVALLKREGVLTCDLVTLYQEHRKTTGDSELLYYASDTHYSLLGKELMLEKLTGLIREADRRSAGTPSVTSVAPAVAGRH